jgi:hypothetical protein
MFDGFIKFFNFFNQELLTDVLYILTILAPFWLPILLWKVFWKLWVDAIRSEFHFKQKYIVVEIKLPKENFKSPRAMELFLNVLHQTGGESTWFDKYWLGKTRTWWSLELVSINGQVKFFIWMRASWKPLVESGLYAQFPNIEVHEAKDYALDVNFDPRELNIWGCDFKLDKPDPYPIRTYVDYGLDDDPKEEYKNDPLLNVIEFLGSLKQGEQGWIQIVIRAHKKEQRKPGHLFKQTDAWKDDAQRIINQILIRDPKTKSPAQMSETGYPITAKSTKGEEETVLAIERSISKLPFDTGIRILYIAKRDVFNPTNIAGLNSWLNPFGSETLNNFKRQGGQWSTTFDYPWQDFKEFRQNRMRAELLQTYKRRSFFHAPYVGSTFVLNTEELATIYHFPGQVVQTPSLVKVTSKKSEPPANLPI